MSTSGNVKTDLLSPHFRAGIWLILSAALLNVAMFRTEAHEGATGIVKERMNAMSEDASDIEKPFKNLSKPCLSCHRDFRRKKKRRGRPHRNRNARLRSCIGASD